MLIGAIFTLFGGFFTVIGIVLLLASIRARDLLKKARNMLIVGGVSLLIGMQLCTTYPFP